MSLANHIDQVVDGVETIAEETNLLALNTSIEAARTGERRRYSTVIGEEKSENNVVLFRLDLSQ